MTLIEKRFYYHQGSTEQIYTKGSDLFDFENLNIKVSDLCKEVNQEDKKRNRKALRNSITKFHVRK
jgi:hypothetical protein